MNPKYSIIMPVYNREKIVQVAIESVIRQPSDWEFIIIDDGSTDNTLSVLKQYAENDKRVRVVQKENGGVSAARNVGLSLALGEYILFVDSDDHMLNGELSCLDKVLTEHPDCDMVVFGIQGGWKHSLEKDEVLLDREEILTRIIPEYINAVPQEKYFAQPFVWNKCFKRDLITSNGIIFDAKRKMWGDNVFVVECLAKANSVVYIREELYNNRDSFGMKDHLSGKFYPELITQYLDRYYENKTKFGSTYDFESAWMLKRYFTIMIELFQRAMVADPNNAEQIFLDTLQHPLCPILFERVVPSNTIEKNIIDMVNRKKNHMAYTMLKAYTNNNIFYLRSLRLITALWRW